MNLPTGNGYFIWQLSRIGEPGQAARLAKQAGLSWVAIKIADGPYPVNIQKPLIGPQKDLVGPFVDAFKAEGIRVHGWHYVYGYLPDKEAEIAASRVAQFNLDSYMIDAEVEYKKHPEAALTLMRGLRRRIPGVPLGICSYRFPDLHREFPWQSFTSCEYNMPQVYWMCAHNAGGQLKNSYQQFLKLGYKMPYIPLGSAFTEMGWSPTMPEIIEFRQTAASLNLIGYGWWEWYDAIVRNPDWWRASTGEVSIPEPVPFVRVIMTNYYDLRIRSGPGTNYTILGYMIKKKAYAIVEIRGDWGRIDGDMPQWVMLKYTVTLPV